ncbi:hypothetical protein CVT25_010383 [Psilocybe cyanescens]|uniref:Protein kinase domain-containing protein n=1 Tax=Psilocybe cyanescens TaxID=93625 RepID=A0A409XPA6_PSICY|nr:hypothetical protein CVT25_010383 [Psilocybe cyanescens]
MYNKLYESRLTPDRIKDTYTESMSKADMTQPLKNLSQLRSIPLRIPSAISETSVSSTPTSIGDISTPIDEKRGFPIPPNQSWTVVKRRQPAYEAGSGMFPNKGHYSDIFETALPYGSASAALKVIRVNECEELDFNWNVKCEIAALKRLQKHRSPYVMEQPRTVNEEDAIWWDEDLKEIYILLSDHCLTSLEFIMSNMNSVSETVPQSKMVPIRFIKLVAVEVANGLNHLHSLGIIHRDIALDNIFMSPGGHCKIGNFSHSITFDKETYKREQYMVTTESLALFEYPVSPPELISAGSYVGKDGAETYTFTENIDVWALGIVLLKLLFVALEDRALEELWKQFNELENLEIRLEETLRNHMHCRNQVLSVVGSGDLCIDRWTHDVNKFINLCCQVNHSARISASHAIQFFEAAGWDVLAKEISYHSFVYPVPKLDCLWESSLHPETPRKSAHRSNDSNAAVKTFLKSFNISSRRDTFSYSYLD